jgi:hypothetical protein
MKTSFENGYQVGQTLYRYEDFPNGDTVNIDLLEFKVERLTPRGAWIRYGFGKLRFVLCGTGKRHAYPTKAEAWESYCIRKYRRMQHLLRQVKRARAALRQAEATWPARIWRPWDLPYLLDGQLPPPSLGPWHN